MAVVSTVCHMSRCVHLHLMSSAGGSRVPRATSLHKSHMPIHFIDLRITRPTPRDDIQVRNKIVTVGRNPPVSTHAVVWFSHLSKPVVLNLFQCKAPPSHV